MLRQLTIALVSAAALSPEFLSAQEEPPGKQHPVLFAISRDDAFYVAPVEFRGIGDDQLKEDLQNHLSGLLSGSRIQKVTGKREFLTPVLGLRAMGAAVGDTTVYTLTLSVLGWWYNPDLSRTFDVEKREREAARFGDRGIRYFQVLFAAHIAGSVAPIMVWDLALVRTVSSEELGQALAIDTSSLVRQFLEAYAEANP